MINPPQPSFPTPFTYPSIFSHGTQRECIHKLCTSAPFVWEQCPLAAPPTLDGVCVMQAQFLSDTIAEKNIGSETIHLTLLYLRQSLQVHLQGLLCPTFGVSSPTTIYLMVVKHLSLAWFKLMYNFPHTHSTITSVRISCNRPCVT